MTYNNDLNNDVCKLCDVVTIGRPKLLLDNCLQHNQSKPNWANFRPPTPSIN
jgi:hypothetical protein